MVAVSAGWSYQLLARTPTLLPWLRYTVVAGGALGALGLLIAPRRLGEAVAGVVAVSLVGGFGGSAAYAVATSATTHQGSTPAAGPAVAGSGMGGMGGLGGSTPSGSRSRPG